MNPNEKKVHQENTSTKQGMATREGRGGNVSGTDIQASFLSQKEPQSAGKAQDFFPFSEEELAQTFIEGQLAYEESIQAGHSHYRAIFAAAIEQIGALTAIGVERYEKDPENWFEVVSYVENKIRSTTQSYLNRSQENSQKEGEAK